MVETETRLILEKAPLAHATRQLEILHVDSVQQREQVHCREVIQKLQRVSRLLSLPTSLLVNIARRAGLRSRRLCRALRNAYGPLDQGLRLPPGPPDQLLHLLTRHSKRLACISTLELPLLPPIPNNSHRPCSAPLAAAPPLDALLTALPASFPRLRSISLPAGLAITGDSLARLGPLRSTLTALHARVMDSFHPDACTLHGLQSFTRLQSLSLACDVPPQGAELQSWLRVLGRLPQLERLSLFNSQPGAGLLAGRCPFSRLSNSTPKACDSLWLSGLARAAPQLTSLSIGALPIAWTAAATAALLDGFPALQHLSVMHKFEPSLDLHAATHDNDQLLAALAGRGAPPPSLDVQVYVDHASRFDAARLPALSVSSLTAVLDALPGQHTQWLWAVLEAQSHLTSLRVCSRDEALPKTFLLFPNLRTLAANLVELDIGWHWDPGCLLASISRLTALRALGLHRDEFIISKWPHAATSQLSTLTGLTALAVTEQILPPQLLRAVSGLTQLRRLSLTETADYWPRLVTVTDADLHQQLAPHRRHLTCLELVGVGGVRGRGLAVLRQLAALQHLEVRGMRSLACRDLHHVLLPLPAALACLKLGDLAVPPQARGALLTAAARQDCRAIFQWMR